MSYITDSRSEVYYRLYVGQALILANRIEDHICCMTNGAITTLHYYVKSVGGKYRQANFLRVFCLPASDLSREDRDLLKNTSQ